MTDTQNSDGVPVGEVIDQLQNALKLAMHSGYSRSSFGNDALAAVLARITELEAQIAATKPQCRQYGKTRQVRAIRVSSAR